MKQLQGNVGLFATGAVLLGLAQPVLAQKAATEVTAVQLNQTEGGINVTLKTSTGDRPQVFTTTRGNALVADIINTKLRIPEGSNFSKENPAPGIASVIINPLDSNSIRLVVTGTNSPPSSQPAQRSPQGLTLGFATIASGAAAAAPKTPSAPASNTPVAQVPSPEASPAPTQPAPQPSLTPAEPPAPPASPTPPGQRPDVLVPEPRITIDGVPAPAAGAVQPVSPAPPFLPRAIAPPVGDISIANVNAAPNAIDLGTAEVVPRLVLRDAPVREVLSLLSRAAGLNLAFTAAAPGAPGQPAPAPGSPAAEGPTISLDIENEPVQDVFNYVLRISNLEANRTGRTIFVGPTLPEAARDTTVMSLRLNQVSAAQASGFLSAQGAETQRVVEQVQFTTVGEGAAARTVETRDLRIIPLAATQGTGPLLLRGLSVLTDERLNAVTLIGQPRKVEIATNLLTQLDGRRRQVAVNVKIIDVNLSAIEDFNSSFSFGIGDTFFVNDGGAASLNFGGVNPPSRDQATINPLPRIANNPYSDAEPFVDPNNQINISGAGPGTTIINQSNAPVTLGGITVGPGQVGRTPNTTAQTANPISPASGDPLQPGFTNITQPTNDIITIDRNGNITTTQGTTGTATVALPSLFEFPRRFLSTLQAQVQNGNAKILTDPTLLVQEGQNATVNLTQEVVGNIRSETQSTTAQSTRTVTAEIRQAGLILSIIVDRIDDNGFVSLSVNPQVTSIGNVQNISVDDDTNQIALLNTRQLNSGQVRLRDGQTLILSGIIQDSDRTTVSKVPILGDIPLLGALFRSTNRSNQRQEVIVLLTPQIVDDSERSTFGYNYTPSPEVRQLLERRGLRVPPNNPPNNSAPQNNSPNNPTPRNNPPNNSTPRNNP